MWRDIGKMLCTGREVKVAASPTKFVLKTGHLDFPAGGCGM